VAPQCVVVVQRFFIGCTPRTGNTWLRKLLAGDLDLVEYPAHTLEDVPWHALAERCAISMHAHATPELLALLAQHHIRVVVTIRHPLDVLISILAYTQYQRKTKRWVSGDGGDESSLFAAHPLDRAFLEYAQSPRAHVLLGVSPEWLSHASAVVRYEALAAHPVRALNALFATLQVSPMRRVSDVVAGNTIDLLRAIHTDNAHHFWRGESGIWKRLLPLDIARTIAEHHAELLNAWDTPVTQTAR